MNWHANNVIAYNDTHLNISKEMGIDGFKKEEV